MRGDVYLFQLKDFNIFCCFDTLVFIIGVDCFVCGRSCPYSLASVPFATTPVIFGHFLSGVRLSRLLWDISVPHMAKAFFLEPWSFSGRQSSAYDYWIVIAARPFQWTGLQVFFELSYLYVLACAIC